MNLTIIVLSKNNDKNLVKFLHEFLKNSPSCSLLIADYGQKRALLEKIINKINIFGLPSKYLQNDFLTSVFFITKYGGFPIIKSNLLLKSCVK